MSWEMQLYGTGTDIYHIVQWFFIYSILGWCVESTYMSICEKRLVNRGFIWGPICPIYGFGALLAYFILKPLSGNYILLYIAGSLMATTFEFIVARVMLRTLGGVWWDYSEKPYNFQGIICLESTLAWGLYTICLFGFLQQGVNYISDLYPKRIGCIAGGLLMFYYLIDFTVHLHKARAISVPKAIRGLPNRIRDFRDNFRNLYR